MIMMNKQTIKFSIMSPVYNVEPFLDECICSVLEQTYKNYELILVDDGSTDKSGSICDKYSSAHDNIKTFHRENEGLISARRFALEKATGDYYIFLDSDDRLKPEALQTIYDYIVEYDCDCVIYGMERVYNDSVLYRSKEESIPPVLMTDKRDIYKKVFFLSDYNNIWRKAVKASLVSEKDYSQYYHISLGEDLLQSIDIYENSKSILFVDDRLYLYTVNPDSITQLNKEIFDPIFPVKERVLEFLQKESVFTEEDYNEFRDYNIKLFVNCLVKLGKMSIDKKEKCEMLKQAVESDYYKSFLAKGHTDPKKLGKRRWYYYLLERGMYSLLVSVLDFEYKK